MLNEHNETIEGTWEEVSRHVAKFNGHRLRVVILPDEPSSGTGRPMITRGMFPELVSLGVEDFKAAEFHGDEDDGTDRDA